MKKTLSILLIVMITIIVLSTQAFASPLRGPAPKNTPGAKATEKATNRLNTQGNKPSGKSEHYKGTIVSTNADSITLNVGGSSVTIALNADTRIHIPKVKDPNSESLQTGMTAMVLARPDDTGSIVARFVQVIPGKPSKIHRVGIVIAYSPGESITIRAHDGINYTFQLTADTKILPAERAGQLAIESLVTLIAPRDFTSTTPIAKGIVVHPAGSGSGAFGTP